MTGAFPRCVGAPLLHPSRKHHPQSTCPSKAVEEIPQALSGRGGDSRQALTSSLGRKYPPSAPPYPKALAKAGHPKPLKVPCGCQGKPAMVFASKPGLGQKIDTSFQSALQPSQARPWGRRDRLGEQLVDGEESNKAFFLNIGRVGPSTSRI